MRLTPEQIEEINGKCPYGQGIFKEPSCIPTHEKRPVLYTKYEVGGRGGSCWDDEDTVHEHYNTDPPKDKWKVLDETLAILKPTISYLEYKKIDSLIDSNEEREWGYYGDYTDEVIEYIVLEELEHLLLTID